MAKSKKAEPKSTDQAVKKLEEETQAKLAEQSEKKTSKSEPAADKSKKAEESADKSEKPEKAEKPSEEKSEKSDSVPYERFKEVNDKLRSLEGSYKSLLETQNKPNVAEMDAEEYAQYVEQRAVRAAESRSAQAAERERQKAEAYGAYPELDPKGEKHNPAFEEAVAGVIVASRQKNPGNPEKWVTAKQAADKVAELGNFFAAQGEKRALEEVKTKSDAGKPAGGKGTKPSPEDMSFEELEASLPKADPYFRPLAGK